MWRFAAVAFVAFAVYSYLARGQIGTSEETRARKRDAANHGRQLARELLSVERADSGTAELVALPDVHGDLEAALLALGLAGLVDANGAWRGGRTHLVSTGDLVDRGPHSLEVLALFERLKEQAREAGGDVTLLLGNHELMIFQKDARYVSRTELERLGSALVEAPNERMAHGRRRWFDLLSSRAPLGHAIRRRRAAAVVGSGACRTLFVHAGLRPELLASAAAEAEAEGGDADLAEAILDRVNARLERALHALDSGGASSAYEVDPGILGETGPFWERVFAMAPERKACPLVEETLNIVGAHRMAIGHTVQENGMRTRCSGKLHLMDVGMSRAYLGVPSAWTCAGGEVSTLTPQGSRVLAVLPGSAREEAREML